MRRSHLEHIIRASGQIAGDDEFIIIGSQAILGQFPDAPDALLRSMETDIYPRNEPAKAIAIDGAIGEGSQFHATHGYYAQGVGPETAILPRGWNERLIPIQNENTAGVTGLCLEVHDLTIAKLVAGREKDFAFARELRKHQMIRKAVLLERLSETDLSEQLAIVMRARINSLFI